MRRFFPLAIVVLIAGVARADDVKNLNGTWLPQEAKLGGKALSLGAMQLIIEDGKYTVQVDSVADKGTLEIDAAKKPNQLRIVGTEGPNKGKTYLAIYELNVDDLKICYNLEAKSYPTTFDSTVQNGHMIVIYKRSKQ